MKRINGHTDEIRSVAFSPDGSRLATAAFDNAVKVWDVAMGRELVTLQAPEAGVRVIAFSPDGAHLIGGTDDGTVKIWSGER